MSQINLRLDALQPHFFLHATFGSDAIAKHRRSCFIVVLACLSATPRLYASTTLAQAPETPVTGWQGEVAANPDWQTSWNTAVRYNLGQRMQSRKPLIANNALYDQGDALFDRQDLVTNRLDLLSEFELVYRRRQGLRVTVAAWYDAAYGSHGRSNPGALGTAASPLSYVGNEFTPYVKKYYAGPGAELLDSFVFGSFDVGPTVWNLKLGRHAVVWGEALFGTAHAIAYSQAPSDGMKGISNPGASPKETALPAKQLSLQAQISPSLALVAQLGFEWRANRVPEGGTFFGIDGANMGPNVNRLAALEGGAGDLGVGINWRPQWLDGMLGIYARRFDDKGGWLAQAAGGGKTRAVYAKDISMLGLALSTNVGEVAVGAELSHRQNSPLVSDSATSAGAAKRYEGAKGDTWHGLINAAASFGPGPLYHASVLLAELSWSRLDRVTDNAQLYRSQGYLASCNTFTKMKGCADKDFFGLTLSFVPSWLQVYPGIDLDMPLLYSKNLRGNAPTNGGGVEGFTNYKIGLTAKAYARHQFDLAYIGYDQKIEAAADSIFGSRVLGAPLKDKAWLSFTYQYTF